MMRLSSALLRMKNMLLFATALGGCLCVNVLAMEDPDEEESSTPPGWNRPLSGEHNAKKASSSKKGKELLDDKVGSVSTIGRNPRPLEIEKLHFILSIDGGGIRGIIPAELLKYLENEIITEVTKHTPFGAPPLPPECLGDMCSLIAGTSTGGIIGLGIRARSQMNVPGMKAGMQGLVDLYEGQGHIIFTRAQNGGIPLLNSKNSIDFPLDYIGDPLEELLQNYFVKFIQELILPLYSSKYTADPLEGILDKYFGSLSLKDLPAPTLVTTYDVLNEGLYLFNSQEAQTKPYHNYKLRDVARATSAAPTYFPAVTIFNEQGEKKTCSDGGVTANNPTLLAYMEAQKIYPQGRFYILSLGCGIAPLFTSEDREGGGLLQWAGDIFPVVSNSSSRMTEDLMYRSTQLRGDQYVRIQFAIDKKMSAMDTTVARHIRYLKGYAAREIDDKNSVINKVRDFILNMIQDNQWSVYLNIASRIEEQKGEGSDLLDLKGSYLTDRALWEVKETLLKTEHGFRQLSLRGNALTPYMATCLRELGMMESLDLRNTSIRQELFKELKNSFLSLQNLKSIDLRDNPFLEDVEATRILDLLTRENSSRFYELSLDEMVWHKLGHYMQGVKRFEDAVFFYEKGSSPLTQLALAKLYLTTHHSNEESNQQYFMKAVSLCTSLGDKGEMDAQFILGSLCEKALSHPTINLYLIEKGLINPEDDLHQKAGYYYKLAADQHHKRSAFLLAEFYYTGKIMPVLHDKGRSQRDISRHKEALKYYQIAAIAGSQGAKAKVPEVESAIKRLEAETLSSHKAA